MNIQTNNSNAGNTGQQSANAGRKALWDKILKVVIALLSAIAGALGANAMQHL